MLPEAHGAGRVSAVNVCLILSEQKPNTAAEYVAAHLSKIHGLDWHPDNEFILATSSQDNSVRVRKTSRLEHNTQVIKGAER